MTTKTYVEKYAAYEQAWEAHKARVNGHRFLAGGCQARFSERDKQEFIRTLALIDTQRTEASEARLR